MRSLIRTALLSLGLALAGLGAAPTQAAYNLYGTTLVSQQLFTADPSTGAATVVGPIGPLTAPFGLAAFNNQLYTFDGNSGSILQLDPATGAVLRTIATGTGPLLGQGGFAIRADGTAFVTSGLDPTTFELANNLFQIDLATGSTLGPRNTAVSLQALAFGSDGTLFALDRGTNNPDSTTKLYRVDPVLGAMTLIGSTGVLVGSPTGALTFDATTNQLFASLDDRLFTLNLATGAATAVGATDFGAGTGLASVSGLAFVNTAAVPEPASFALVGLGLTAMLLIQRRRRPTR